MQTPKRERVSIADRFITALLSSIVIFVISIIIGFALVRFRSSLYFGYWHLVLPAAALSGIVGFVLGSQKMAEVFGFVFRTNKPKDGHWD